jgi:hypothetical protein
MNKRIKELAEQATNIVIEQAKTVESVDWQCVFAELIIKECLTAVREEIGSDYNWDLAGDILNERIFKHFGVENE